ncbi:radical SAM additional 4Fe4S-binding SPASM domain-containing protein [Acetoanaerobium noterae]|uniref:Radical SAM additional 4Fe4S-binding SPASM domain-containing protein n=1 Tax=Acetoanaerobium noterae TaxID=745369 RepID=A0A1T5D5Y4_9FIRM|nr:radical SAM/SPASM domain-containing protein [Acetoanaerobium noterae]SKB67188.1 radical SAM additional 4Fe4S-binding SPASM domain-containing protein [Acetoanaerobium noterae]
MNDYKVKNFPDITHVETTNVCNLKCIHCPQSDLSSIPNYEPIYMELDIFKRIAMEIGKHNGILRLTPDGEPLIHRDWIKQVELALSSGVDIFCFNTNGILLSDENMEILFKTTETKVVIEISIDALYPDTYKKIRGGDYSKLMKNIFTLLNEKNKRSVNNIKVMVSCVIQPELENQEYQQFVKFWEPLVDKVITRHYVDTKGLTPQKPEVQFIPKKRWPCPVVFTRLVIGMDGKIRFCPDDWLKKSVVGDINKDTIEEIWKSKYMNNLRASHMNEIFDNALCNSCTDWSVIRFGNDYVKALKDLF